MIMNLPTEPIELLKWKMVRLLKCDCYVTVVIGINLYKPINLFSFMIVSYPTSKAERTK